MSHQRTVRIVKDGKVIKEEVTIVEDDSIPKPEYEEAMDDAFEAMDTAFGAMGKAFEHMGRVFENIFKRKS